MINDDLLGIWVIDPMDSKAQLLLGDVTIEFKGNGEIRYSIKDGSKIQVMLMTYRIEDNFLITDQPSAPREEKTEFKISDGKLSLTFEGVTASFTKVPTYLGGTPHPPITY